MNEGPAGGRSIAAAVSLPVSNGGTGAGGLPAMNGSVLRLISASFLMGAASTAVWSFGGQLASQQLGWGPTGTGILWTCIGAAGIAGAWAGALSARFGIDPVHRTFLGLMAASIIAVGLGTATPAFTLIGGALFGGAYVMVSGVYLIWGVQALPDRPATGLMIGFLMMAVGQTAGAPVFGLLMAGTGPGPAIICFAGIAILAGIFWANSVIGPVPA